MKRSKMVGSIVSPVPSIDSRARSTSWSSVQSLTATPMIGHCKSPRRSSRYSDLNVITFARSPVIPKITKTSAGRWPVLSGWPCTGAVWFSIVVAICCLLGVIDSTGMGLAAAQPLDRVQTCPAVNHRMRIESSPRAGDCARLRGDHPRRVMTSASARVMVKYLAAAGETGNPRSRRDPAWQMTSTTTLSSSGQEPGAGRSAPARHEWCEGSLAGARAVPAPGARQLADRSGVRTREVHRARDLV